MVRRANSAAETSVTQSLDRAMELLRLVGARSRDGVRLSDLASLAGLAKPTTHRLVRALERQGLIERSARGDTYHLGRDIFILGVLASERHGIARIATPFLQRIAQVTEDTVLLTVRQGSHGVCILREEGDFPIRTHALRIGDRHPLGVGSNTLAILAALDDAEIDSIIAATRQEVVARYPAFSELDLQQEVAGTRAAGYAFNPGRLVPGSWGMAVPLFDASGQCVASLSIAAIERRVDAARRVELAQLLAAESVGLSRALGAPPSAQNAYGSPFP